MSPRPPSTRKATAERWISNLGPLFDVIQARIKQLGLGEPRLQIGPTYLKQDDMIRRGALWGVDGQHLGFHVDFKADGVFITAWSGGERRSTLWVHGKASETTLNRDLKSTLTVAGLTDLAHSHKIRDDLFRRSTPPTEKPAP